MDKIKLRSVIFWVLTFASIAFFTLVIFNIYDIYLSIAYGDKDDQYWGYNFSALLQATSGNFVYLIVSARTVYCLKTGNLFDNVNVYIFFCLTVLVTIFSVLITINAPYIRYFEGWQKFAFCLSYFANPLFLLLMSLLYLGAYRAEESNRLTI